MCVGNMGSTNMGAASLVGQAAGAVSGAAGAYFGAESQKMGLNLQAYFNSLNAQLELDNARETYRAAGFAEQRSELQTASTLGSQRAAMGANGVDMSTGSALNSQVSTLYVGDVDKITIEQNAAREAAGYKTAATSWTNDALFERSAAKGISPMLAGLSSLVGSAGKISSDWYRLTKVGALPGGSGQALGGGAKTQGFIGAPA